ncbi:amidase 1-like [Apium graveolens]|uniref:amidase 1-like n=1 Tax=Apium graveolens TaxID=4045 RepID=UPI003D7A05D7
MERDKDYGAFMERFTLQVQPTSSSLIGLTFAVKDIFDMEGYVTGFGNPDWAQTHSPALSTAPAVMAVLKAGATCVGKTIMDEMAYSINGENVHYGTPTNPCAPDRVPGGSSSGSAVGVGASLVDFSLGTDTGGSIRVPASYCGIFGFRPSHGAVPTTGVTPMAQSFDTAGWFARDPAILNRVGRTLLQHPDNGLTRPLKIIIAEDCFKLLSIPSDRITNVLVEAVKQIYGDDILNYANLGDTVERDVPSLKNFMRKDLQNHEYNIEPLVALSNAMRLLQRYEFKNNHGEWVKSVKPHLGPGIAERVWEAINAKDDNIDACLLVKTELQAALRGFLEDVDVLAIPTVPGPPPKLQTEAASLETFRVRAFSLLSVAGVSGFCQVSIPLGMYDNLPVSVSLLARNGRDKFLLDVAETLYGSLKEQVQMAERATF